MPERRIEIARCWRAISALLHGFPEGHALAHSESILRRAYPEVTGLTRLQLDKEMLSTPLLIFDGDRPPDPALIDEHFHFRGGQGRQGAGSWANYRVENGEGLLPANRAGWVESRAQFPPAQMDPLSGTGQFIQIDAELWSDLLMGTAFEFAGQRMYFGHAPGGIHFEGGWVPQPIVPIYNDRFHDFLIEIAPGTIKCTVDGIRVGELAVESIAPSAIVLRGWEGHVRCRRLAVWEVPAEALPSPIPPASGE